MTRQARKRIFHQNSSDWRLLLALFADLLDHHQLKHTQRIETRRAYLPLLLASYYSARDKQDEQDGAKFESQQSQQQQQ